MPEHLTRPRAVLFDLYGTLIDILTDEHSPELWTAMSRFLRYQGVVVEAEKLRQNYFAAVEEAQAASAEEHPEIDVEAIFGNLCGSQGDPTTSGRTLTRLFRSLSIVRLDAYPDTLRALRALKPGFRLGLVSNAQRLFLETEMEWVGVAPLLDTIVVSSDYGYTKPDGRLFALALERLGVGAGEAIYVGDNAFRDVCGARGAGIYSVLLKRCEYQSHERDCQPDATFANLDEMVSWLQSLEV